MLNVFAEYYAWQRSLVEHATSPIFGVRSGLDLRCFIFTRETKQKRSKQFPAVSL